MSFVAQKTPTHRCSASDKLAFPAQILQRAYIQFAPTSSQFDLSIPELSDWRLTSIGEWRSTCHTPMAVSNEGSIQCHCPASHTCGAYLVIEFARTCCGCRQSMQIRANANSEQFVFLDQDSFPPGIEAPLQLGSQEGHDTSASSEDSDIILYHGGLISDNDGHDRRHTKSISHFDKQRKSTALSSLASQNSNLGKLASSGPQTRQELDLLKHFLYLSPFSKSFSLADFVFLLYAIQKVHVNDRWTETHADRSLIDFTIPEAVAFIRSYANDDWKSQVWKYRKNISQLFYDRRIDAWNWWLSNRKSSVFTSQASSSVSSCGELRKQIREEREELSHQRRLLAYMKERDSFLKVELNLLWTSTAVHECASKAALQFIQRD